MKTHAFLLSILFAVASFATGLPVQAAYHFSNFTVHSPLHIYATTGKTPKGLTPSQVKTAYKLPATGGKGTIAIIDAYNDTAISQDLADFDKAFGLPACTSTNGCLTKKLMSSTEKAAPSGWALETALDVEWAHAIAPNAKILLVEAATPSGANLLNAVDYAAKQKDISAISMSWGGDEFPEETTLDSHFVSVSGAPFFAASGDEGTGASWPASSPNVIGVGGTSLAFTKSGSISSEKAWTGSGGGVSAYEKEPSFQSKYSIPKANGMRAVPDVAYNADPTVGYPIVHSGTWRTAGGTSAGAPQWAAIAALGKGAGNTNFYADKASSANTQYFRDIVSGENGTCGYYCIARAHYDYVTGLGSPLTVNF